MRKGIAYAARTGNEHGILGEDDRFCRYCGTRRGEGSFLPYENYILTVYGPPISQRFVCGDCGYEWAVRTLGGSRARFCPRCGSGEFRPEEPGEAPNYPCHIHTILNAQEARNAFRGELVKDYGDCVRLGKHVLHWNHVWDDGGRVLMRCSDCGGLMLIQTSEFHSTMSDDGYYEDWIPVASAEEADLMNIFLDADELDGMDCHHLMINNGQAHWSRGESRDPMDPERLKRLILKKYADQDRELLDGLIRNAGKTNR